MRKFWKEWVISASSGLFSRPLFALILLGGGIMGSAYLLPEESAITKSIVSILPFIVAYSLSSFVMNLPLFKEWSREARAEKIKELELKNENLKLEIELQKQKQLPPPDDDEEE